MMEPHLSMFYENIKSRTSFKEVLRLKEHEGQEMRVLSYKGKAIENVK